MKENLDGLTPRICEACGHPENKHPYRHIFKPLSFNRPAAEGHGEAASAGPSKSPNSPPTANEWVVREAYARLHEYLANGPSPEVNAQNLRYLDALRGEGSQEGGT